MLTLFLSLLQLTPTCSLELVMSLPQGTCLNCVTSARKASVNSSHYKPLLYHVNLHSIYHSFHFTLIYVIFKIMPATPPDFKLQEDRRMPTVV